MTRRSANRQKLADAASAARTADDWIGAAHRHGALATAIGHANATGFGQDLLQHERLRRRFPAFAADLGDAIKAKPKLGGCLADPEALYHLALMSGAGIAGGAMTRVVSRQTVSDLIAGLGRDVWEYGVAQGAMPDGVRLDGPNEIIAEIEHHGCNAVFDYLEATAKGLGIAAFDAAGLPHDVTARKNRPPQDQQNSVTAVQGAMEHLIQ